MKTGSSNRLARQGTAVLCRVVIAALALMATAAQASERTLSEWMAAWSGQYNINVVLGSDIAGDTVLDLPQDPDRSLSSLEQLLAARGFELRRQPNGDRLLLRSRELQVSLSQLSVEDTALPGPINAGLAERVTSATRLRLSAIEAAGDHELDDLYLRVGNVFGARDNFYIRGVPRSGDLNTLGNANVYLEGVPLPDALLAAAPVSTWDIDAVSFDRGALTTRQDGPFSAYSGAIHLDYGSADYQSGQRLLARYTDLDDIQVAATVNQSLIEEELAVRGSIEHQALSGTLRRIDGAVPVDDNSTLTARISLLWQPVSTVGVNLNASLAWIESDGGPQSLFLPADEGSPFDRRGQFAPIERQDVQAAVGAMEAEIETPVGRLYRIAAGVGDSRIELDTGRPIANELLPRFEIIDRSESATAYLSWSLIQPVLDTAEFDLSLSAGQFEESQRYDRDQALWDIDAKLRRWSVLAGYQHRFSNDISVQARVRYDRDRLIKSCRVNARPGAGFAEEGALSCTRLLRILVALDEAQRLEPLTTDFDQWSPELALAWDLRPGFRLFARGYRGFNSGGAAGSVTLSGQPFWIIYQPEVTRNLESGLDVDVLDGRLQGRLTAFYGTLENQWIPELDGATFPLGQVRNSGRSRHYGLEWDGRWDLGDGHDLRFSLGWLRTRFVDFLPFDSSSLLESASGNQFPGAPEFSGSLGYRFDPDGPWRFAAVVSHHGEAFANANNVQAGRVPDATIVDLTAAFDWRSMTIRAEIRNALDEQYLETTPRLVQGSNLIEYSPGRPRSLGISLEYRF